MSKKFSYDEVPYPGKIFTQTHPNRMATLAAFAGMKSAPVENCRVLELGCGNGINLIAQAFYLPESEFVGVDLAQNHIEYAENAARQLNLPNIEFHQADVMNLSAESFGKFDYVFGHGLFSWVPDFVREKILRLCREILTENAVGYLSYNAFPGMRHRQMAQEIMRHHAAHFENAEEKIGKSTAFLNFLAHNSAEQGVYTSILQKELKRLTEVRPSVIFHDNLSEINQPFYFKEFAAMLKHNDLQFLGETRIQDFGVQDLTVEAREFIGSIEDINEREQYLDFFRGRIFRETLFCRREIELNHQPKPEILNNFFVSSTARPAAVNPSLTDQTVEKFTGQKDASIEIDQPLVKIALYYLGKVYGNSVLFPQLLEMSREILESQNFRREDWKSEFETAAEIFFQLSLNTELVKLSVYQPEALTELSEKPKVDDFILWQFSQTENIVTRLGYSIKFDFLTEYALKLLDGTRGCETVSAELEKFIEANDEIENKQEVLQNLPSLLPEQLKNFARLGIFTA